MVQFPKLPANQLDERQTKIVLAAAGAAAVGGLALYVTNRQRRLAVPKSGKYPPQSLPEGAFDAVIVGGGPSGSTCAYYMAQGGAKVCMLPHARPSRRSIRVSDHAETQLVLHRVAATAL